MTILSVLKKENDFYNSLKDFVSMHIGSEWIYLEIDRLFCCLALLSQPSHFSNQTKQLCVHPNHNRINRHLDRLILLLLNCHKPHSFYVDLSEHGTCVSLLPKHDKYIGMCCHQKLDTMWPLEPRQTTGYCEAHAKLNWKWLKFRRFTSSFGVSHANELSTLGHPNCLLHPRWFDRFYKH